MNKRNLKYDFDWHLKLGVCRTMNGCRRHTQFAPLFDLVTLCRGLNCGVDQVADKLWNAVKDSRINTEEKMPLFEIAYG